jgi:hypothetical protein
MHRRIGIRLALLLVVVAAFAVTAPVALSDNTPAHPRISSGCRTVSGTFGHWIRNGDGQLFAFTIKNGPQVRIKPTAALQLAKIVKPGDKVTVTGCVSNRQFRAKTVSANGKTISG